MINIKELTLNPLRTNADDNVVLGKRVAIESVDEKVEGFSDEDKQGTRKRRNVRDGI